MKKFIMKYVLYLVRWQLSTPILAVCVVWLKDWPTTWSTAMANLIGGLGFFWIDKLIFTGKLREEWEIRENVLCCDCGKQSRGYRLVFKKGYDKRDDPKPEFRCEACSITKKQQIDAAMQPA
ncbi:MAG TPA: hypothetical protein PL033_04360 [Candidatus Brocadiia bacterium]|nr:hypothetical protein [Candidatus Brocadiia bacterium]